MPKNHKSGLSCSQNLKQNQPNNTLHHISAAKLRKHHSEFDGILSEQSSGFGMTGKSKKQLELSEIRQLCEKQEKQVLSQYRSNCMFQYNQFYEYIEIQLKGSSICQQILSIKKMSNQQVQQQLQKIQRNSFTKWHKIPTSYPTDQYPIDQPHNTSQSSQFSQTQSILQHEQHQNITIFKQNCKKVSMIEQNDDDLDIDIDKLSSKWNNQIQEQEPIEMEDEGMKESRDRDADVYGKYGCQYYENDDVFEF